MFVDEFPRQLQSLNHPQGSLLSSPSQQFFLAAVLPAFITLLTLLYDALTALSLPKALIAALSTLSAPFENFLTVDELKDVDETRLPPVWKIRALTSLALINSAGWLTFLAYVFTLRDNELTIQALVAVLAWVCNPGLVWFDDSIGNRSTCRCE